MALENFSIIESTLREGEQFANAFFSSDQKDEIARLLDDHPEVEEVYYPGLTSHPSHEVAKRQMKDFGGMISFVVKGGAEAARRVAQSTKLWTFAVSLGGVESLIEVPALLTHAVTANSTLAVSPALIRLSVGLEDVDDLWTDLRQALESGE